MADSQFLGLCCAREFCRLHTRAVTFKHYCVKCKQLVHAFCGNVDGDDNTTCFKCIPADKLQMIGGTVHPKVGDKSPRKEVLDLLEENISKRQKADHGPDPDSNDADKKRSSIPEPPVPNSSAAPPKTTSRNASAKKKAM